MIELANIHQFQFVNTYCNIIARNKYTIKSAEAVSLFDGIVDRPRTDDRLDEVLVSADLRSTLLLIASLTTRRGILTLFDRLKLLNAWSLQAELTLHYTSEADAAREAGLLLDDVDTVLNIVI